MKKATMHDIARDAQVSQTTVSRVINNHPNVNVAVRERVMNSIKKLNYVPNKAAQTLKKQNSNTLGLSITDLNNPYFAELVSHIEKEARNEGYSILLHNTEYNPLIESSNIDAFLSRQTDGIICVPVSDYNHERIRSLNTPTIAVTLPIEGVDSVYLNHPQGGALAANHFIKNGHTKFGVLSERGCFKARGFIQELYAQGMTFDNENYIEVKEISNRIYNIKHDIEDYLCSHNSFDFTAIFCGTDASAFDFTQVAHDKNLKVPEDIAVIGFDDTIISKINRISSIHQPLQEMAQTCLKIILEKINHPQTTRTPVDIQLTPTIIVRDSSNYEIPR